MHTKLYINIDYWQIKEKVLNLYSEGKLSEITGVMDVFPRKKPVHNKRMRGRNKYVNYIIFELFLYFYIVYFSVVYCRLDNCGNLQFGEPVKI